MAFKLKSKEEKFFSVLEEHAKLCHEAGQLLVQVFENEIDKEEALTLISEKEVEADELVNIVMTKLRKTFITPMDREDIQTLIDQLDNTIDSTKDIMDKMCMYHVGQPTPGAVRMAKIASKCMKHVQRSISYMDSLKKDYLKVEGRAMEVLSLEEKADFIYHEEMATLFTECKDPIEIIKWKEILDSMENVIDGCEDLVGTFRRVVLKYA